MKVLERYLADMGKQYTVCMVQIRKMPVRERYMHVYWEVMDKTTNDEVEQLITRITKLTDSQKQQVLQEVTSMLESSSVSKTAPSTNISGDSLTSDDTLREFHTLMMEPGERSSSYLRDCITLSRSYFRMIPRTIICHLSYTNNSNADALILSYYESFQV